MRSAIVAGAVWAAISIATGCAAYLLCDQAAVRTRLTDEGFVLEWIALTLTAIVTPIAAFRIHVRGRTPAWRSGPLVLFAAWQILTISNSIGVPMESPAEQILYGHSPHCFLFIIASSIPLAGVLFWLLLRVRRQIGPSVAPMAGLSVASLDAFLLQFFHTFEMNFGDWSIHFLAFGIVVGSATYVRQLLPSG